MNQFFVDESAIADGKIIITGNDVRHIENVLRLRNGEEVAAVAKTTGMTYFCTIESMDRDSVTCIIDDAQADSCELPVKITLFQGLPKGDKLEFVIQKAVEMGASAVVPVAMRRSVMKIDPKKAEAKRARWQSIAESAASQSKRSIIPEVSGVIPFAEAVKLAAEMNAILVPYELSKGMDETREILEEIRRQSGACSDRKMEIAVFIGPEGGFEESEIKLAADNGAKIITLGKRILRTETAPIAILAWLTYLFEN